METIAISMYYKTFLTYKALLFAVFSGDLICLELPFKPERLYFFARFCAAYQRSVLAGVKMKRTSSLIYLSSFS